MKLKRIPDNARVFPVSTNHPPNRFRLAILTDFNFLHQEEKWGDISSRILAGHNTC